MSMHSGTDRGSDPRPTYTKPSVVDYGDLVSLTASQGMAGAEDGMGKTVQVGVGGTGGVSVGVGP